MTDVQRRLAWFRWLLGVVVAVAVSIIIIGSTVNENAVQGCLRSTADRWVDVQFDKATHDREALLAGTTRGYIGYLHGRSAIAAQKAADDKLKRTAPTAAGREELCRDYFPNPIPFVK